jgi:hypothetical protein
MSEKTFVNCFSKRSFSMTENERFGLVFAKTGSIKSGRGLLSRESGEEKPGAPT